MAAWAALPEGEEQALQCFNQHNLWEHWQIGMEYEDATRVWYFQHYGPNPIEGSWSGNIHKRMKDEQEPESEPNHAQPLEEMNRRTRINNLIWQAEVQHKLKGSNCIDLIRVGGPFRPRSSQATGWFSQNSHIDRRIPAIEEAECKGGWVMINEQSADAGPSNVE